MPARIILAYAAAVCLFFLAVLGYATGFFASFGVPKGIDQRPRAAVLPAAAIDLLLTAWGSALRRKRPKADDMEDGTVTRPAGPAQA